MLCRVIHSARETEEWDNPFRLFWLMTGSWSLLPAVRGIQWTLCGWPWAPVIIPTQHQQQRTCLAWCCAAFMCLSSTMDKKVGQIVMWRAEKSSTFVRISSEAPRRSANTPSCILSALLWKQHLSKQNKKIFSCSKIFIWNTWGKGWKVWSKVLHVKHVLKSECRKSLQATTFLSHEMKSKIKISSLFSLKAPAWH